MLENKEEGCDHKRYENSQKVEYLEKSPETSPVTDECFVLHSVLVPMNIFIERHHSLLKHVKFCVLAQAN